MKNMKTAILFALALVSVVHASPFPVSPEPVIMLWHGNMKPDSLQAGLVVAVFANGDVWWSTNIMGGAPFFYGNIWTNEVAKTFEYFQEKDYFALEYSAIKFDPDTRFVGIYAVSGTNVLNTRSWDGEGGLNTNNVTRPDGIVFLNGLTREENMADDNPEHIKYRAMWRDVRSRINDLLPHERNEFVDVLIRWHKYKGKLTPVMYLN